MEIEMTRVEINYLGLIFDCPIGNELPSCSFCNIRKFKIRERLTHYEALSNKERDFMVEHHQQCISRREKRPFFTNRNNVD